MSCTCASTCASTSLCGGKAPATGFNGRTGLLQTPSRVGLSQSCALTIEILGSYGCADFETLNGLLKDELCSQGYVMSDQGVRDWRAISRVRTLTSRQYTVGYHRSKQVST